MASRQTRTSYIITSKKTYALTAAGTTPSGATSTYSYGYASYWGDMITSYRGVSIIYDDIGNPLSYYNGSSYSFSWTGRQLTGATKGGVSYSFTYNDEGIRTSKTKGSVTTTYYLDGARIVGEETGGNVTLYLYDSEGLPIGMQYRAESYANDVWDAYWFEKNLHGDIVAVYDTSGTQVAHYRYDAWGNCTASNAINDVVANNPFRYRGYYYDKDLGLYYLGTRYYDANIGRFISPDGVGYLGANGDLNSYNLYAYCSNNPVMYVDPSGNSIIAALIIGVIAGAAIGGAIGGTVAYNSAKSSGSEGSELFWKTMKGIGEGATVGGIAGGIFGLTGGVISAQAYGATSIAGTALITGTLTIAARATEVGALQYKKSAEDGKDFWQIANDCIDSVFSNGGKIIISPALMKAGTTSAIYVATDIMKHKVVPLGFNDFLKSTGGKVWPYVFAVCALGDTAYSMFCTDPIARANQRGYGLR